MAYPVTLNGRTYTLADFSGQNYVSGFPDALEDFVTEAGQTVTDAEAAQTAAETAQTGAEAAQTAAEAAQTAAEAAQEAIDGLYLGAQASNPTVDLNGDPLTAGDWYFNTTDNNSRVYDGSAWNIIDPDLSGDASPTLGGDLDGSGFNISGVGDLTITGDLTVDTNTLVVDSTNNRVGIGTSPSNTLRVSADVASGDLVYFNNENAVASDVLRLNTLGAGSGTKVLDCQVSGVSKFIVNGLGDVGIGTTAPDSYRLNVETDGFRGARIGTTGTSVAFNIGTETDEATLTYIDDGERLAIKTPGRMIFTTGSGASAERYSFVQQDGAYEALRIDASGRVGIGDSTPDAGLKVVNNSGAVIATSDIARQTYTSIGNLQVSTAGSGGILIHSESTTADGAITFGDGTFAGRISYEHDNDALTFTTATSERVRIDDDGHVGIGLINPTYTLSLDSKEQSSGTYIALESAQTNFLSAEWGGLLVSSYDVSGAGAGVKGSIRATSPGSNGSSVGWEFNVGSSAGNDRTAMTITSDGNVGINTDAPTALLDLRKDGNMSVALDGGGSGVQSIRFRNDGVTNARIASESANENLLFYTESGADLRMIIDRNGHVGIGETNPNAPLHVKSNDSGATLQLDADTSAGNFGTIALRQENGTTENGKIVWNNSAVKIRANTGAALTFDTNGQNERGRFDSGGNFLVGKTSAGFANAGCRIQQTGDVRISKTGAAADTMIGFYKNGSATAVGTITSTSTGTSYNETSDERLKENIVDAPAGNIDAIRVRSFDWKVNGEHRKYGFIAQELEAVAPYAVTTGEGPNDTWGVDYSKLVPLLVKEIQQLRARVATLETK